MTFYRSEAPFLVCGHEKADGKYWTVLWVAGKTFELREILYESGLRYGYTYPEIIRAREALGMAKGERVPKEELEKLYKVKRWSWSHVGIADEHVEEIGRIARSCGLDLPRFPPVPDDYRAAPRKDAVRKAPQREVPFIGADPGNGVGLGDEDVAPLGEDLPF